ncbi:putative gamma-glutamyltranspeptidase [Bradyrhizobium sp. STM 3843]|uniref:gamma-glutamyltransferase family protein n=1 Tax=Bradyrhizobium sp. STM 3843 TaxID=551947 RepID=UPI000240A8D4|nr:gamma-glutamyltransferase [Bradyrhizobium sp. STM 3843]CCE04736.1 putative gamma-glutamyltranspeptidase [Bradyrhizobium sp. STM 3843]
MPNQFSRRQEIRKPAVSSKGGIVAAQSRHAAEIGADVLAAGGDCVDAVVATGFALGVLEPWMSGIGGGGAMVLYRAKENRVEVIDYGMRAPDSLRVADYPLLGDGTVAADIFPWARVKDDRNLHGPGAIAVPGVVAGMEAARQRYAKLSWQELVAPSVTLAGEGLLVDWWTTVMISSAAADLRRYPASAAAYLNDALPPNPQWGVKSVVRLPQQQLKATLAHLAAAGARDFYQGDLARSIARDIQAAGGGLSVEDLASFKAHHREPLKIPYRGGMVFATPELTAGPTLAQTLRLLQANLQPSRGAPDPAAYLAYVEALQAAYRERLNGMGDADGRRALGAEYLAPACTTHYSVVDRDGNMAAVTQTLLSTFGSKFQTPQSGIMMNNGIMWFDPAPGTTNSLEPGKRCLTNYTPVVAEAADGRRLALGASGGRRILPAVTQMLSFVMDFGMDLNRAIHQPRIDTSEGDIVGADTRLSAGALSALKSRFDVEQAPVQTLPLKFACPSLVLRDGDTNSGATEIFHAWSDAVAEA